MTPWQWFLYILASGCGLFVCAAFALAALIGYYLVVGWFKSEEVKPNEPA